MSWHFCLWLILFLVWTNGAPTALFLDGGIYTPPSTYNQVVGTFRVIDENPTYHVLRIIGGADKDVFNINDYRLRISKPMEGRTLLQVIVRAEDWEHNYVDQAFLINATRVPPSNILLIPGLYQPPSTAGQVVGNLSTIDANTEENHTYTIISGGDLFYLNGTSLVMSAVGLTASGLNVTIRSTDSAFLSLNKTITVKYRNVAPYGILLSSNLYIPPSAAAVVVGVLTSLDYNSEDTFTYNVTGGPNASLFNITGNQLRIVMPGLRSTNLTVNITTTDAGGLQYSQMFLIQTVNVPPDSITVSPPFYDPRQPLSYTGYLMAHDNNPEQSHRFIIMGGNDNEIFRLSGAKLTIIVTPPRNVPFTLQIMASDGSGGSLTQNVTIYDLNVAPYDIMVNPSNYTPPSTVGMYIGQVSGLDYNYGQSLTFSLQPGDPMFELRNGVNLYFIAANVRKFRITAVITASDGMLNFTKGVSIGSVNLAPTNVYFQSGGTYVPPSVQGVTVGILQVDDPNEEQQFYFVKSDDRFTFKGALVEFAKSGLRDPVYQFTVTAYDGRGLSVTRNLSVTSVNVPPYDITLLPGGWTPPSTENMSVSSIHAADYNIEQSHTFTLLPGDDAEVFQIIGNTLYIKHVNERRDWLWINIMADDGHGGNFTKKIPVRTSQVPPYSLVFIGTTTYYPPSPMNFTLGYLVGEDYNIYDTLLYRVTGGPDKAAFYLEGTNLFMVPGQRKRNLVVQVTVQDPRRTKSILLNFTALNVPPTAVLISSHHYQAPASVNATVGILSAVDANIDDQHEFEIYGGHDANLFSIVDGNRLRVAPGTNKRELSVVITATDQDGATVMQTLEIFAGACPPSFIPGPGDSCYKYLSDPKPFQMQEGQCEMQGFSSPDTIGPSHIPSIQNAESQAFLTALSQGMPTWLEACNTSVSADRCVAFYPKNQSCIMIPCDQNLSAVCMVPMGSALPWPFVVDALGTVTAASAYNAGQEGAIVMFATGTPTEPMDGFAFLNREIEVDYFDVDATIIRVDPGVSVGLGIDAGDADFFVAVSPRTTPPLLYITANVSGMQAVEIGPVPLADRPTHLQLSKRGRAINVTVTLNKTISVVYTFPLNMTIAELGSYKVGLAMTTAGGTSLAHFSSFHISQGAIRITQFIPSQGAVNVDPFITQLVVTFDRVVYPAYGNLQISQGTGEHRTTQIIPLTNVSKGNTLTYRLPTPLTAGTTYYVELPEGLVRDVMSRDAFQGTPYLWTFITDPTPDEDITSTPNITIALDCTLDRFLEEGFCAAIQTVFPSLNCSQIEILSISAGSIIVVFRINALAAPSLESFLGILAQTFDDGSLSSALSATGLGSILPGSAFIAPPTAEEMPSLFVSLNPSSRNFPTRVTIVVSTTMTGLPKGGYVELVIPPGFGIAPPDQIVIRMQSTGISLVQYCNVSGVLSNTIGFFTNWPFAINGGHSISFTIERGITMPPVCWGLNNWIWGVLFYDSLQTSLSNFILANPPNDQCDGAIRLPANTAPHIIMEQAYQITEENTPWLVSKPIKVIDIDAGNASDAHFTAKVTMSQPGSRIQLWPPQFQDEAVTILAGSDNSSFVRFTASPFQMQYAFANMKYYPQPNFYGVENMTIVVNDNGYCCDNNPMEDSFTLPFYVIPVNDPPTMSTPVNGTLVMVEEGNVSFSCFVNDSDAGENEVQVTVTVTDGSLSFLADLGNYSVTVVEETESMATLQGTMTNLNAVLATALYFPVVNFAGVATIQCYAEDLGNGPLHRSMPPELGLTLDDSPSLLSNTVEIKVKVVGVNDPPTMVLQGVPASIREDTSYTFKVFIDDPDPTYSARSLGPGLVNLQLFVPQGTLTIPGLNVTAAVANDTSTMVYTISNNISNINAAVFTFRPLLNWNGQTFISAQLYDSATDGGLGPSLQAQANVTFNILPVNDAPVLQLNATRDRGGAVVFNRTVLEPLPVFVSDVDAGNGTMDLSVTSKYGLVFMDPVPGLRVVHGNISGGQTVRVSGTLSVLQAALASLRYLNQYPERTPIYNIVDDLHNLDNVTVTVNDRGSTGSGGALSATLIIPLRVTARLWHTCQEFLDAMPNAYCGCYYKTVSNSDSVWTQLPTTFPSAAFLSASTPHKFMQGCCADMILEEREGQLVRLGELGTCSYLD